MHGIDLHYTYIYISQVGHQQQTLCLRGVRTEGPAEGSAEGGCLLWQSHINWWLILFVTSVGCDVYGGCVPYGPYLSDDYLVTHHVTQVTSTAARY